MGGITAGWQYWSRMKNCCFVFWRAIFLSRQNQTSFKWDQSCHLADDGSPFEPVRIILNDSFNVIGGTASLPDEPKVSASRQFRLNRLEIFWNWIEPEISGTFSKEIFWLKFFLSAKSCLVEVKHTAFKSSSSTWTSIRGLFNKNNYGNCYNCKSKGLLTFWRILGKISLSVRTLKRLG